MLTQQLFKGIQVPVWADRFGNDVVSLWARRSTKEVVFSYAHAGPAPCVRKGEGWVPVTYCLPQEVAPRAAVPDGIVTTVEDLMTVFYPDYTVIH
ncbi:MAG: hypothetical protein LC131_06745 [Anaerolineae bacterium]|nr:hypothetical protein [Anaerolineae bacterium]GIK44941.1 MAG: hypothetical protein BroJett012_08440 [Betaproteobacteria bacterium]